MNEQTKKQIRDILYPDDSYSQKQPNSPQTGWRCMAISLQAAVTNQSHMGIFSIPKKNVLSSSSSHSTFLTSHSRIHFIYSGLGCLKSTFPTRCGLVKEGTLSFSTECPPACTTSTLQSANMLEALAQASPLLA